MSDKYGEICSLQISLLTYMHELTLASIFLRARNHINLRFAASAADVVVMIAFGNGDANTRFYFIYFSAEMLHINSELWLQPIDWYFLFAFFKVHYIVM